MVTGLLDRDSKSLNIDSASKLSLYYLMSESANMFAAAKDAFLEANNNRKAHQLTSDQLAERRAREEAERQAENDHAYSVQETKGDRNGESPEQCSCINTYPARAVGNIRSGLTSEKNRSRSPISGSLLPGRLRWQCYADGTIR